MKQLLTLSFLVFAISLSAQPPFGDLQWPEPCTFPAAPAVDLTGDSIPDLMIMGWSEGTDDVPSSGGYCSRGVGPAPGSDLLISGGSYGPAGTQVYESGDTITPEQLAEGLTMQRLFWGMSDIRVVGWGYGNNPQKKALLAPEVLEQVFVFRSVTETAAKWGSFRIRYNEQTEELTIVPGVVVDMDSTLTIP